MNWRTSQTEASLDQMGQQIQGTQSLSRSIGLLQTICDQEDPPGIRELLSMCQYTRPTLYRLLAGLEAEELIVRTSDRRYLPGPRLVSLARKSLARNDIRDLAQKSLILLRDETGETVHLATPSQGKMIYIDKIESRETVRMSSTIGTIVPLHSTAVGKAYLAALPTSQLQDFLSSDQLIAVTPYTQTDPQELLRQLEGCQRQGFIFEKQENETGIACFGAAILNEQHHPVAAVSVSIPLFRLNEELTSYVDPLLTCVRNIEKHLGKLA